MLFGMFDFHTRETPPSSEELARAYKPYIETCITACGPDRGMLESNFPPDGVSSRHAVLWNAFKLLAAGYGGWAADFNGAQIACYNGSMVACDSIWLNDRVLFDTFSFKYARGCGGRVDYHAMSRERARCTEVLPGYE
jgi:hypothetical protein